MTELVDQSLVQRQGLDEEHQGDPTGLERAFDDRYFMASSELNLLNTMLFVAESSPSSPGMRPER